VTWKSGKKHLPRRQKLIENLFVAVKGKGKLCLCVNAYTFNLSKFFYICTYVFLVVLLAFYLLCIFDYKQQLSSYLNGTPLRATLIGCQRQDVSMQPYSSTAYSISLAPGHLIEFQPESTSLSLSLAVA